MVATDLIPGRPSALQAGFVQPNKVIAKREMEQQEKSRLRRLSEVRPSSSNSNAAGGGRQERPSSAGRFSRNTSRPPSGQLSGHRQTDEFSSFKARLDNRGHASDFGASSPSGSPGRAAPGLKGGRRSCSETARLRTSFMLSPTRRMEDAASQFPVNTAEQARALQEELQSWYFSDGETFNVEIGAGASGGGGLMVEGCPWTTSVDARSKPTVDVLEEAAAAVSAKVAATGAFRIPPPMPGSSGGNGSYGAYPAERGASQPGRGSSGGCRGVAAATANRRLPCN